MGFLSLTFFPSRHIHRGILLICFFCFFHHCTSLFRLILLVHLDSFIVISLFGFFFFSMFSINLPLTYLCLLGRVKCEKGDQ